MSAIARRVFVISDLHLGGVYPNPPGSGGRGFRICTHPQDVAAFIDKLTQLEPANPAVELVINGDLVDFLAETNPAGGWSPFTADAAAAVKKFNAIVERDRVIFDAMKRFLARGHRIVLLLGNHDLELCFPPVRQALRAAIGAGRGADFEFFLDGEAYLVGDALIEHGNRYDAWNMVDYDGLRRIRSLQSRGQPIPNDQAFHPPAGSFMVADVINPIKTTYAFIDLLKPETGATVPLVLALEPGYRSLLAKAAMFRFEGREHKLAGAAMPAFGGDISSGSPDPGASIGSDISSAPARGGNGSLDDTLKGVLGSDSAAFMAQLNELGGPANQIGSDISSGGIIDRGLSFLRLLTAKAHSDADKRLPLLLTAFQPLLKDQSFDPAVETAKEYLNAAQDLARNGIRHVVFGHTHMPKRIQLSSGGWYLNSGTWADVLQFPAEIITGSKEESLAKLQHFTQLMIAGDFSEWTVFQPTYVRLDVNSEGTVANAELCRYSAGDPV
jgi:UDP-2,3-diacylglucosamine pyrophosphatase LpxH